MTDRAFKCHNCSECAGNGCKGQMPGMGGVRNNENFILNCEGWKITRQMLEDIPDFPHKKIDVDSPIPDGVLRLAPMTGAKENMGFPEEEPFYANMIFSAYKAGLALSIGDGCPDIKLQSGISAIEMLQHQQPDAKAAVFIKPYADPVFYERMEWSRNVAEVIGIDIDSYNILTMRNLVNLEKKTASQLAAIRAKAGVPFALKGIFTQEDVQLVREVKPDIIYISNHGGRIETRKGSTAEFLLQYGRVLKENCSEIWIDGGIRCKEDIKTALSLGVSQVLIGRPCVTALCYGGTEGLCKKIKSLLGRT